MTMGPKIAGACLACGRPCFAILQEDPETGRPLALGAAEEHQTQIEFLLSDGSEADITFCLDCAAQVTPEHYPAIWRACIDAAEEELKGRSPNERRARLAASTQTWIMGRLRARRHDPDSPGGGLARQVVLDRRLPGG